MDWDDLESLDVANIPRKARIVVELRPITPARKREYAVLDEPDSGNNGSFELTNPNPNLDSNYLYPIFNLYLSLYLNLYLNLSIPQQYFTAFKSPSKPQQTHTSTRPSIDPSIQQQYHSFGVISLPKMDLVRPSRLQKRKLDEEEYHDGVDERDELEEDKYLSSQTREEDMKWDRQTPKSTSKPTSGRNTRRTSRLLSTDHEDSQTVDDDDIILERLKHLRPRRGPSLRTSGYGFSHNSDIDELAQDFEDMGSDGDFVLVQSDIQPKRAAKRKKRSTRTTQLANKGKGSGPRGDSIEFEAPKRSLRKNKHKGGMYEIPGEGDEESFYIDDDKSSAAPKAISVKEVFQPADTGFRAVHSTICNTCDSAVNPSRGSLVLCQGCSYSYHRNCLGLRSQRDHLVTKVGQDSFVLQCRFCINIPRKKDQRAPDLACCQTCHQPGEACKPFSKRKTAKQEEQLREENGGEDPIHPVDSHLINNDSIVLFRCATCRRGFHLEHLPRPAYVDSMQITSDTIRAKNLKEYSIEWNCQECNDNATKADALVAWRPKDSKTSAEQSIADYAEDEIEYLVKWEKQSYRHCTWLPGSWVWGTVHAALRNSYLKRIMAEGIPPHFDTIEAIPEEYVTIDVLLMVQYKPGFRQTNKETDFKNADKVEKVYAKFVGLGYDAAVWDDPPSPDSEDLYKAFLAAYDEYLAGVYFKDDTRSNMAERLAEYRKLDFAKELESPEQPRFLTNGELMRYQISGVNWLKFNFHTQHNAILADEMGLGKTVQIVAMVADLVLDQPRVWPFLIVVPNATVPNWRREMRKWAPDLRVVTYHGGRVPQDIAYRHELFPRNASAIRAHVVVMSYEAAQDPATRLRFKSVRFAGLVVDEGHRLKNDRNLLYGALMDMKIPFKVLLTGTPLQNNKRELFNLLQFLDPGVNAAQMDEEYNELTVENIPKLHDLIRPFFLRRTKADTLLFLPKMARVIIPVTMTVLQNRFSRSIMEKNGALLHSLMVKGTVNKGERASLNNILMQLRKVLCHPYMYSQNVEERSDDPVKMFNNLVEASSKLLLLQIMLPKLKERGHRVLLFSQFLDQLDILEDFLIGIGLTYSRIDGKISSMEKQKRIDAYNEPDSPLFAMLLSTRAGGVGINLATADTVIVLDPDFNPHQDLQALSRSHRIGQKKPVLCFTITTKDSAEEKIMQAGRKKMALDHALIESLDHDDEEKADLGSILAHSAELLFGNGKRETITYDSASVDQLLDRDRLIAEQNPPKPEGGEEEEGTEGRKSRPAFGLARVWDNSTGRAGDAVTESVDEEPAINHSVWEEIIKAREEEARREAEANREELGRGARRRGKAVQYSGQRYGPDDLPEDGMQMDEDASGYDTDFMAGGSADDSEEESEGDVAMVPGDEPEDPSRGTKSRAKASQGMTPNKKSPSKSPKKAGATSKKAAKATPTTAAATKMGEAVTPKKAATSKESATRKTAAGKKPTPRKSVTSGKTTPAAKKPTPQKNVKPNHVTPKNQKAAPKRVSAKQTQKKQKQKATAINSAQPQTEKPTPSNPAPVSPTPANRANGPEETLQTATPTMATTRPIKRAARNEGGHGSTPQHGLPPKPPIPLPARPPPARPPPVFSMLRPTPQPTCQAVPLGPSFVNSLGRGFYPNAPTYSAGLTGSMGPTSPSPFRQLAPDSQPPEPTVDPRLLLNPSISHQLPNQGPLEAVPSQSTYPSYQMLPPPTYPGGTPAQTDHFMGAYQQLQ